MVCRICLGTEEEGQPDENGQPDKLICPCKCAGSMGMIHISCLKEWVNGKRLVYKGRKVQSFFWKALECELCNEAFENRMKYRMF
jgi:E3 ubiquitin-protein ligase DOA10